MKIKKMKSQMLWAMLYAVELGYKLRERGHSLELSLNIARQILNGERERI